MMDKGVSRWPIHLVLALALAAAPAAAQQPAQQQAGKSDKDVNLSYAREVFTYPAAQRRDPFLPLTDETGVGPRFEDLSLQGIMYSPVRGQSVALLTAGDRIFTVHPGDVVGNSRVVEIGPTRVVFAVNNFGTVRQEMLELKRKEGAGG